MATLDSIDFTDEVYEMTRFFSLANNVFWHRSTVFGVALVLAAMIGCEQTKPPKKEQRAEKAESKASSGKKILEQMAAAYRKASSYADAGQLQLIAEADGEKVVDQTYNFSFTFERPNKVRAQSYFGMLVCNGKELFAAIENLRGQVVLKPAPAKVTFQNLFADRILAMAMSKGLAGMLPQPMFLLADDASKTLLREGEEATLLEPGDIEGQKCHRVEIKRPEGSIIFWIDKDTLVLRRIVLPTEALRADISRNKAVNRVSLIAEFRGAQLNGKINPKAFEFEVPQGAIVGKFFVPPHMAQLLEQARARF